MGQVGKAFSSVEEREEREERPPVKVKSAGSKFVVQTGTS